MRRAATVATVGIGLGGCAAAVKLCVAEPEPEPEPEPGPEPGPQTASLRGRELREFALSMLPCGGAAAARTLTSLDVSHNELGALPGLETLAA
eukprot:COSAG04_NODE_9387_length_868_cov_1.154746_1_plen_92_part_01